MTWDTIIQFLSSGSVVTVVVSAMVIAFAKAVTRIFRMGATFKADLVSKKEFREFEDSIRHDTRAYCAQIQKIVTEAALTVINDRLSDVSDAKEALVDIKIIEQEMKSAVKSIEEKYDDVRKVSSNLTEMQRSLQRLEYNDKNSDSRRDDS